MNPDDVFLKKVTPPTPKSTSSVPIAPLEKAKNPIQRIYLWGRDAKIRPYATVRNLNDPLGKGDDIASKPAVEVGIKFTF